MIGEAEKRFREAERSLDELLRRDGPAIEARGVNIADWSGRAYHYKNERLSWCYWFEVRRWRGSEIEKVWVEITLGEEDPDTVKVRRCAEIFQIGKFSRWRSYAEELLPLDDAVGRGLSDIVLGAISAGEAAAADAV